MSHLDRVRVMRLRCAGVWVLGLIGPIASPAMAAFVPGRLYVCTVPVQGCSGDSTNTIYEFDPATGSSTPWLKVPKPYCGLSGMTFTPDGSRLRVSNVITDQILEIDGEGNVSVALGSADGIKAPIGTNNVAYDKNGNFFVSQVNPDILMKFPAGGGAGVGYDLFSKGVTGYPGAIDTAPNGDVYYAEQGGFDRIWRVSPRGTPTLFDSFDGTSVIASIAVDDDGDVFVLTYDGLYRYDRGDPASMSLVSPDVTGAPATAVLALGSKDGPLFAAYAEGGVANNIWAIDTDTGSVAELGYLPPEDFFVGLAVSVPEPGTLVFLFPAFMVLRRRTATSARRRKERCIVRKNPRNTWVLVAAAGATATWSPAQELVDFWGPLMPLQLLDPVISDRMTAVHSILIPAGEMGTVLCIDNRDNFATQPDVVLVDPAISSVSDPMRVRLISNDYLQLPTYHR